MEDSKSQDTSDNPRTPAENPQAQTSVPKPPEDEGGQVDEKAAVDTKPPTRSLENNIPSGQPERPESVPAPTVAELDKSHEKDLDKSVDEPAVEEKPADDKKNESKKGSSAMLAVVVALLVTLLLVGIGYAAWQASQSPDNEGQNTEDNSQATDESIDTSDADQLDQDLQQIESDLDQLEADVDVSSLEDEAIGL